jgi:hypothetical protein
MHTGLPRLGDLRQSRVGADRQKDFVEANRIYRVGDPEAMAAAEAIVRAHMSRTAQ